MQGEKHRRSGKGYLLGFQEKEGRGRQRKKNQLRMDLSTIRRTASKEAIQSQILPFSTEMDQMKRESKQTARLFLRPLFLLPAPKMAPFASSLGSTQVLGASSRPLYGISWSPASDVPGAGFACRSRAGIRKHLSCTRSPVYLVPKWCFLARSGVGGLRCLLSGPPGAVRRPPHPGPRPGVLS